MTLIKKINLAMMAIVLLLCGVTSYVQFNRHVAFLQQQLQTNADTLLSNINFSLIPILESNDHDQSASLFHALMSNRNISEATLVWLIDGTKQYWRAEKYAATDVPAWFRKSGLIQPVTVSSTVRSGWLDLAQLKVTFSAQKAYSVLWSLTVPMLAFTLAMVVILSLIIHLIISRLLSPVPALTAGAERIARQDFSQPIPQPHGKEFRQLATAFNKMAEQLSQMFSTLNEEVEQLREKMLYDAASGLPNRQHFNRRMASWMDDGQGGVLILARLHWLDIVNQRYGYQVRDDSWRLLKEALNTMLSPCHESLAARLNREEIAIILPGLDHNEAMKVLQDLIRQLNHELSQSGIEMEKGFTLGLAEKEPQLSSHDFLAKADNALQQALEDNRCFVIADSTTNNYTRQQWRQYLTDAIERGDIALSGASVLDAKTGNPVSHEVYCQLKVNGEFLPAARLLPHIHRLELGAEFDRKATEASFKASQRQTDALPFSRNITQDAIRDTGFVAWLASTLQSYGLEGRFIAEISEASAIKHPESTARFCQQLKEAGIALSIDQVGRHTGTFNYLQALHPDYIKLDQSFSSEDELEGNGLLILPVVNMANSLGIRVVVTGIAHTGQLKRFEGQELWGYQGEISPQINLN